MTAVATSHVVRHLSPYFHVAAPSGPNAKQKALYRKLNRLSGSSFDKAFVKHKVSDHKHDVKDYQKEATKTGANADYASSELLTLRKHLQTAQTLKSEVR